MGIFPQGDNPKDPLKRAESEQLELTRKFGLVASGFSNEAVLGAAINVFVNAIRQTYPTLSSADARYTELVGKFKSVLLGHYDSVTGKRRSIFPFHQTISPVLFKDEDTVHKHKV